MGIDIHYQAMPDDCPLLKRAIREPEVGSLLNLFPPKSNKHLRFSQSNVEEAFISEAHEAIKRYPGLEARRLYPTGRNWDVLYYLLSPQRRAGEADDWEDLACRAIKGGQVLNEGAVTGIGFPVRYLSPVETCGVLTYLQNIDDRTLAAHYNAAAMSEACVYKAPIDGDDARRAFVLADFTQLRDFYRVAVVHNEGVLTFTD